MRVQPSIEQIRECAATHARALKAEAELRKCYKDIEELTAERDDQKQMLADAGIRNGVLEARLDNLLGMYAAIMANETNDCPKLATTSACGVLRGVPGPTSHYCLRCWRDYAVRQLEEVQL